MRLECDSPGRRLAFMSRLSGILQYYAVSPAGRQRRKARGRI
jgi:hypothetical protein